LFYIRNKRTEIIAVLQIILLAFLYTEINDNLQKF